MKLNNTLKYLGSGILVYTAVWACGGAGPYGVDVADGGNANHHDSSPSLTRPVGLAVAQNNQGAVPLKVLTADTDPAQLVGIPILATDSGVNQKLQDGGFMLTDVRGHVTIYVVNTADGCGTQQNSDAGTSMSNENRQVLTEGPLTGVRIWIPAGKTLCARESWASGWVSGFRPYL